METKDISILLIGVFLFAFFILGFPYFVFAESPEITICEPTSRIALCRDYLGKTGNQICQEKGIPCTFFCEEYYSGSGCSSNYVKNCDQTCENEYWVCCESPIPPICECTSGPCCDGCHFRPENYECKSWYEYKCSGTGCGKDVLRRKASQYCNGKSAECEGEIKYKDWEIFQDCQPWEVCASTTANLFCDDKNCEISCDGKNEECQPISPLKRGLKEPSPLQCSCWGKCLPAIKNPHYYDGVEDFVDYLNEDCEKISDKWEREKCQEINQLGIPLPIDFGWEMPPTSTSGWLKENGVKMLKVEIGDLIRFLKNEQLLDKEKWGRLEKFIKEKNEEKILEVLKEITGDESLIKEKIKIDLEDEQRLKQILYFIYFRVKRYDPLKSRFGDDFTFAYSPSQDKIGGGPCRLRPGQDYHWKVKLCCNKNEGNCGPPDPDWEKAMDEKEKKKWNFKTSQAAEPIDIVEVEIKKWEKGKKWDPIEKKFIEIYKNFFASTTSWIDTDWNGKDFIEIREGDYVDFNWCGSGNLRAFFKDKVEIGEKREIEEEKENNCSPPNKKCICEEKSKESACLCDFPSPPPGFNLERDCKTIFLEDFEICHPINWSNIYKSRIHWDFPLPKKEEEERDIRETIKKEMEENCVGLIPYPGKLAEEEVVSIKKIIVDSVEIIDNPYYPLKFGGKLKWKWDISSQFFNQFNVFNWQIGEKSYGQKWSFSLVKSPPMEWSFKEKKMVPVEKIEKIKFAPEESEKNFSDSLPATNRLRYLNFPYVHRIFFSYRVRFYDEDGNFISIPKRYSVSTRWTKKGGAIGISTEDFPINSIWACLKKQKGDKKISDQNYYRLNRKFKIEIDPCQDVWGEKCYPNFGISQVFLTTGAPPTFEEPDSGPGVSTKSGKGIPKVKIPRKIKWDPVPGAASYFYEINGPKNLKGVVPVFSAVSPPLDREGEYRWKVKSCADKCCAALDFDRCEGKEWLQCGEESEEMVFYGCLLEPPKNYYPPTGEQFFPKEKINLSWDSVNCANFYQYKVEFVGPLSCSILKERENRKKCKEMEKFEECQKLLENKKIVPITTIEKNSVPLSLPDCLGSFSWSVRACIDKDCQEVGNWSGPWTFETTLEKYPKLGGAGEGFGTCKNLIPCSIGNCRLEHIPMLIENLINCILWTLSPTAVVFLIIYTGILFYFSFGEIETLAKVKSIWRSVGIGWLIMLFSWTILNLIYTFLGYRESLGQWWNPLFK